MITLFTSYEFNNVRAREFNLATGRSFLNVAKRSKSIPYIICAYSWIRTNALSYPYERFLCLSGLTDSISNISRHYFDSSIVSCSVYASNLYRQIGNAGRVSTYTFNLCGCVLSRCIFIQPRLLNYNAEISSIMNGCFPPLLCILLELVLAGTVSSRRIRLFKWQCTIPSSPLRYLQ